MLEYILTAEKSLEDKWVLDVETYYTDTCCIIAAMKINLEKSYCSGEDLIREVHEAIRMRERIGLMMHPDYEFKLMIIT